LCLNNKSSYHPFRRFCIYLFSQECMHSFRYCHTGHVILVETEWALPYENSDLPYEVMAHFDKSYRDGTSVNCHAAVSRALPNPRGIWVRRALLQFLYLSNEAPSRHVLRWIAVSVSIGRIDPESITASSYRSQLMHCDYNAKSHWQRNTPSDHHLRQSFFLQPFGTMATQQHIARRLGVKFRVLIIGRANAGKTSILQRVCDTTESPEIYRVGPGGYRYQVCSRSWWGFRSHRLARFNLTPQ